MSYEDYSVRMIMTTHILLVTNVSLGSVLPSSECEIINHSTIKMRRKFLPERLNQAIGTHDVNTRDCGLSSHCPLNLKNT